MAANFAALEARLTACVFKHLPNATASAYDAHGQLQTFDVMFDGASQALLGGMVADTAPRVMCQTSAVTGMAWDSGVTVAGTDYAVATIAHVGTGVTTLTLREA